MIEKGSLEYYTPAGKTVFSAGSGGMVNSNVLHMTKPGTGEDQNLLHLFDTSLIAGSPGSRIEHRYVTPLTSASQIEIIALYPENPAQYRRRWQDNDINRQK